LKLYQTPKKISNTPKCLQVFVILFLNKKFEQKIWIKKNPLHEIQPIMYILLSRFSWIFLLFRILKYFLSWMIFFYLQHLNEVQSRWKSQTIQKKNFFRNVFSKPFVYSYILAHKPNTKILRIRFTGTKTSFLRSQLEILKLLLIW
jgi:hypothetical protein